MYSSTSSLSSIATTTSPACTLAIVSLLNCLLSVNTFVQQILLSVNEFIAQYHLNAKFTSPNDNAELWQSIGSSLAVIEAQQRRCFLKSLYQSNQAYVKLTGQDKHDDRHADNKRQPNASCSKLKSWRGSIFVSIDALEPSCSSLFNNINPTADEWS